MRCVSAVVLCSGLILLVASSSVSAQTPSAQIAGLITDVTRSGIPGASISVTSLESGVVRTLSSNLYGYYAAPLLPPGLYQIMVQSEGFRPAIVRELRLAVNQAVRQDFLLEVGAVVETIEVSTVTDLVQSSTAELGLAVSEHEVHTLPLNGRNFTQLLVLEAGISPANVSQNRNGGNATSVGEQTYPAVNGQGNRSNIFLTDGALNVGTSRSTYAVPPIVDAIQEFKVQSHNDLAEFGSVTGGIINVVTKSGTNTFHGSGWWFHRNDELDARDFFRQEVTPLAQHMYGGTLGGPIAENSTFFFIAYQGYKNRRAASNLYRVPTEANLSGDMSDWPSQIYDPFSTHASPETKTGLARNPFPANHVPASLLDGGFLDFVRRTVPAPVFTGVADRNQINTNPVREDQREYNARADHTFGENDAIWGRVSGQYYDQDSSGNRQTMTANDDFLTYNFSANWLHTFDAGTIFDFQFTLSRVYRDHGSKFPALEEDYPQRIGFNRDYTEFASGRNLMPNLYVKQFFSGGEMREQPKMTDTWTWRTSYSKLLGNHQVRLGAEFTRADFAIVSNNGLQSNFDNVGTADPNEQSRTGSPLASFLLDIPDMAQKKDFNKLPRFGGVWGIYFQDSWKVTPRLTLNLGLRYNRTMIPALGTHENRYIYHGTWDFSDGTYLIQADPGSCADVGAAPCIPTPGGVLPDRVVVDPNERLLRDSTDNWQPRFGIAYRLADRTAIRGSFGVFFDNFAGIQQMAQNNGHTWPDVGRQRATNLNSPAREDSDLFVSAKDPFPGVRMPEATPYGRQAWYTDPNWRNSYSLQWNFGIQRQLSRTMGVSVDYVGSGNRRLPLGLYYNIATAPGPGDPAKRRMYPDVQPNWWQTSWGRSSYNSLQARLRKRFSGGFSLLVNYTWSKSIDTGSSGWFAEAAAVQDPYHFNNDRSVSSFDLPHMFNTSVTYELPWRTGRWSFRNRLLDAILEDWQLNCIVQFTSGQPYTVTMNGDPANTGMLNGWERPDALSSPQNARPEVDEWFHTGAFSTPNGYRYGNSGRNILRRDGMNNFDISLMKNVSLERLHEGARLELRIEAFNAFNSTQFGAPDANLSNSNFGRVMKTAISPRQVQLGMRIAF